MSCVGQMDHSVTSELSFLSSSSDVDTPSMFHEAGERSHWPHCEGLRPEFEPRLSAKVDSGLRMRSTHSYSLNRMVSVLSMGHER